MAQGRHQRADATYDQAQSHKDVTTPLILAIGDVSLWRQSGRALPADGEIQFAEFYEIDTAYIETVQPDVILSPLVTHRFDCIDLAQLLSDSGFKGRYRAMAPSIPNPNMIRKEISTLFPSLDFDIVQFSAAQQPKIG